MEPEPENTEPKKVEVRGVDGSSREVPLVNLQAVLQQQQLRHPVEISTGALVFGGPRATITQEINAKYRKFLKEYYLEAHAEAMKIMQS